MCQPLYQAVSGSNTDLTSECLLLGSHSENRNVNKGRIETLVHRLLPNKVWEQTEPSPRSQVALWNEGVSFLTYREGKLRARRITLKKLS